MNELARILACAPEASCEMAQRRLGLAEKACAMTNNQNAGMLTTLAAAYAESGRFEEAIVAAQKARELAANNGQGRWLSRQGSFSRYVSLDGHCGNKAYSRIA